jgi:hypothetical protein
MSIAIQANFKKFHEENPHVYEGLLALTRQAYDRGRSRIGIKMLFEVLRWNRMIQTNETQFKLNNNYHALYARLIMDLNPELEGIFETRERHNFQIERSSAL